MSEIVEELQGCDAAVCFAVDATQITKSLKVSRLYAIRNQSIFHVPRHSYAVLHVMPDLAGFLHVHLFRHNGHPSWSEVVACYHDVCIRRPPRKGSMGTSCHRLLTGSSSTFLTLD